MEFFRKTSKLSRNVFWTSWDHLGAQKSHFKKKSRKMSQTQVTPPGGATVILSTCPPPLPGGGVHTPYLLYKFFFETSNDQNFFDGMFKKVFRKNDFKKFFSQHLVVVSTPCPPLPPEDGVMWTVLRFPPPLLSRTSPF